MIREHYIIWLTFLTRNDLLSIDNLNDPNLKKALNILNVMNFMAEEREVYEDHLKWLRIETNTIKNYEQRSKIRVRQKGKAERNIAMLLKGNSVEKVAKITGLSIAEIVKLKS